MPTIELKDELVREILESKGISAEALADIESRNGQYDKGSHWEPYQKAISEIATDTVGVLKSHFRRDNISLGSESEWGLGGDKWKLGINGETGSIPAIVSGDLERAVRAKFGISNRAVTPRDGKMALD